MLDLARVLAVAWALGWAARARAWGDAAFAIAVAYLVGLEVASGFAIRSEGAQPPVLALLLVFLGPSGMPRGALPSWPLARAVVLWPATVHAVTAAALAIPVQRLARRVARLSPFSAEVARLDRLARALTFVLVLEGMCAVFRGMITALLRDP